MILGVIHIYPNKVFFAYNFKPNIIFQALKMENKTMCNNTQLYIGNYCFDNISVSQVSLKHKTLFTLQSRT
jgi:hypothetical protein